MSAIKYRGWFGVGSLTKETIIKRMKEGYNALFMGPADVFDYQLATTDPPLAYKKALPDLYALYIFAKEQGCKLFLIDASWGRWPYDTNDYSMQVINYFAGCKDVIMYCDEPQNIMDDTFFGPTPVKGLSAFDTAALMNIKQERAEIAKLPFHVSITERTRNSELHELLKDALGEENIVYSSYYLSCFLLNPEIPFTWQMGQLSTSNAPTTAVITTFLTLGAITLLNATPWLLALIPILGLFPFYPLQSLMQRINKIPIAMQYQGNVPQATADGFEQYILKFLGFNTNALITLTNWINRKLFLLFFK